MLVVISLQVYGCFSVAKMELVPRLLFDYLLLLFVCFQNFIHFADQLKLCLMISVEMAIWAPSQ